MDIPGYIALSRLIAQQRSMEVIANNVANAETPGFKGSQMLFAEHVYRQTGDGVAPGGREVAFTEDRATWRSQEPGALQHTGNPFDVALSGDGFFVVRTPRGDRYTRAGRFSLSQTGGLVDVSGNAVVGADGRPIVLAPSDTRIEIGGDGSIRSENGPIGRMRVVSFAAPQKLMAEGDRLFAAGESQAAPQDVQRPGVVQGAFEGSNVRSVVEMTRLMTETREFQFTAQFVERESQRLTNAIQRILRHQS